MNKGKMRYQAPAPISRNHALKIFSNGTIFEICDALVSIACFEQDWKWSQDQCLHFLNHCDPQVSGLAATCLGHIARIHRKLDKESVVSALKMKLNDEKISGRIQDALDDIDRFL